MRTDRAYVLVIKTGGARADRQPSLRSRMDVLASHLRIRSRGRRLTRRAVTIETTSLLLST
jgi:hypothetical protein